MKQNWGMETGKVLIAGNCSVPPSFPSGMFCVNKPQIAQANGESLSCPIGNEARDFFPAP